MSLPVHSLPNSLAAGLLNNKQKSYKNSHQDLFSHKINLLRASKKNRCNAFLSYNSGHILPEKTTEIPTNKHSK